MDFRVKTTRKSEARLRHNLEVALEKEAGETGLRWFQGLRDAVASLSEMPLRCALAPESEIFPFEVRPLLYGNRPHVYRILFTLEGNTVTVLHIRQGRRLSLGGN